MSDRVAVLHRGQCVQCDRPEVIFTRPRTRFVAQFFRGCNVMDADVEDDSSGVVVRFAGTQLRLAPGSVPGPQTVGTRGVAIRHEDLLMGEAARLQPVRLLALLEETVYKGTTVDHNLRLPDGQRLVATDTRRQDGALGQQVCVGLDPSKVVLLED